MGDDQNKKNKDEPSNFDELIEDTVTGIRRKAALRHKPRAKRVSVSISLTIEFTGQIFFAKLVDISEKGIRIDQEIPNAFAQKCIVTLATKPPMSLPCVPIIDEREFERGTWNRLLHKMPIELDKIVAAIQSAPTK